MTVVLARHIAEARRRIAQRFAIDVTADTPLARALRPPAPRWWECEPHASDALWKLLVERAIEERAWRSGVDPDVVLAHAKASPIVADEVLVAAAGMLHAEARRVSS